MIHELPELKDPTFKYEHLFSSPKNEILIQDFSVGNPAGENLGIFLKDLEPYSEKINADRTYLVKDKLTEELAGYFSPSCKIHSAVHRNPNSPHICHSRKQAN